MRPCPILLACFLAAASGSAQQSQPTNPSAIAPAAQYRLLPHTTDASCPVSLDVGHRGMVYLYDAEHQTSPPARMPAQSIEVNLVNLGAKDIVAVDAHVQGIPGIPHLSLMPLRSEGRIVTTTQPDGSRKELEPEGASKDLPVPVPFHAELRMSPESKASLEWTIENVGSIAWVQIDRIAYADGTVWERPQADSCKVVPDPMVLVK